MSFLATAAESAFTGAGTGAAAAQGRRQSDVGRQYADLFGTSADQLSDWQHVIGNMHLDGSLLPALNALNAGPEGKIKQYGAGANERATTAASQYGQFLKSQGYGDGATNGAAQGFYQNAAAQTNQYAAQQYSPEAQAQAIQQLLATIGAGNGVFGGALNSLGSGVYGQPQVQVQDNPLASILGQVAGMAASYYTGGATGAAGAAAAPSRSQVPMDTPGLWSDPYTSAPNLYT